MDLHQLYRDRIGKLQSQTGVLKRRKRNFGIGRLISFLSAILLFFLLLSSSRILAVSVAITCLAIFIFIALKDLDNTRVLLFKLSLLGINEEELVALDHHFEGFEDGLEYLPVNHPYAADLDILGPHGLYQLINRTTAATSAALLADRLLNPSPQDRIGRLQEAIRELQPEIDWRQNLQARGRQSKITKTVYEQISQWSDDHKERSQNKDPFTWLSFLLPAITLLIILLADAGLVSWRLLWLSFCAHLLLVWRIDKMVAPAYESLSEAIKVMDAFYESLECLVSKSFTGDYLRKLQLRVYKDGVAAPRILRSLGSILNRMELRLNPLVHFPLNLVVFWDWHQYRQLQQWRRSHPGELIRWLEVFSEMEVLSSFANLIYNHPDWCFPEIADHHFTLSATSLGHPLLGEAKRICNDVNLDGTGKILLITGSNMAGKSTFLRTVGVNMVLAMAGSAVCARQMTLSEVRVITSMRIADNLEENISTFYAELKKLEMIIQKVRAHEKVFLLLDEILRGTNSLDRHAGARALIGQLLGENAVGILATHDLELTALDHQYPGQLVNYHFDVHVQGEELYFDYKLKPGVCTSMNASVLMRKIGINI